VKTHWEKQAKELRLLENVGEEPSTLNVDDAAEERTISRKNVVQLVVMEIQPE
jgi:hypothetical protein